MFNTKPTAALIALATLAVLVLVPAGESDGADISGINTSIPHYSITENGSTTYHQATSAVLNGYGTYYYIFNENQLTMTNTTVTVFPNNPGADISIVIPANTTLALYNINHLYGVNFSPTLSSVSISGSGLLIPVMSHIGKQPNTPLGFNGVPATMSGVSYDTGRLYAGSAIQGSGYLDSTDLTIDGVEFSGTIISAGSRYDDVGDASLTVVSINMAEKNSIIYGGNSDSGTVETSSLDLRGRTGNTLNVYGGGGHTADSYTHVGSVSISATGGTYRYIFGGAYKGGSTVGSSSITLGGDVSVTTHVYGGGEDSGAVGSSTITMNGGSVGCSIYASGKGCDVGTSEITMNGGEVSRGILAGGRGTNGVASNVDSVSITVNGGTIGATGDKDRGIYSGGGADDELAGTTGSVTIRVTDGNVHAIHDTDAYLDDPARSKKPARFSASVTGGSFATDVSQYVSGGYSLNSDGEVVRVPSLILDDEDDEEVVGGTSGSEGRDDTVTVVACAAAAVVAALMAAFLILDRRP